MKNKMLKNQKGMSLLEVVVSMLICGIGLAGMTGAIQASQRLATSAEYRAIAAREVQSAIDMMRANRLGSTEYVKSSGGKVDTAGIGDTDPGMAICKDRAYVDPNDTTTSLNTSDYKGQRPDNNYSAIQRCLQAKYQAEQIAKEEATLWTKRIRENLPEGSGKIDAENKAGIYVFTVKVEWKVTNTNKDKGDANQSNPIDDKIHLSFAL